MLGLRLGANFFNVINTISINMIKTFVRVDHIQKASEIGLIM